MCESDFQTDLLIRWSAQLERLKARRFGDYSIRLQEKVLLYLISRYSDPNNWNRFAAKSKQAVMSDSVSAILPRPLSEPSKPQTEFGSRLRTIHEANEESYLSYGLEN